MAEFRQIVQQTVTYHQIADYGRVRVKLAEMMKKKGITRNRLQTLTGINYATINRYYKSEIKRVDMVDLDFLARVCYALDCKIEDLLEYEPPTEETEKKTSEDTKDGK